MSITNKRAMLFALNKMKKLMMLLLFCHVTSAVKHSMNLYLMGSSGVANIPEFAAIANVEEVIMTYYDSNIKTVEPRHYWARKLMEDDPQYWERLTQDCMHYQQFFIEETESFKQHLNQTGGVHINQQIVGCELDGETEKADGYNHYHYNGEDFLTFDLETETWIAVNPQAEITKQEWDKNKDTNGFWKNFIINTCPEWLKMYLNYGKTFMQKTDPPSVSLLQKTPSSPVSCHATGFYFDRAMMFWRKDGEELHEEVDLGEILPNNDGSFQMGVDLNLSSVTPEDWRRYDCVFHLSGMEDDIVTKLDKAKIRTNWGKKEIRLDKTTKPITILITAVVVVLAIVFIAVIGFIVYKKRKANRPPPPSVNISELSERLKPET
ncbi:major histocompatibility complex class I-related gene protein-like isoform X2 [Micropterus salmoides]|uniref:major histocompatibility complex class I-related gene protein-like isoform X2 n=1 Tax=Micropterus salmoides TaxID=27706 RepID=UPI0018EB3741|nr:major histocompatibility complex class I-related gene protein-like isoform X2 [Micropterus salmoides]